MKGIPGHWIGLGLCGAAALSVLAGGCRRAEPPPSGEIDSDLIFKGVVADKFVQPDSTWYSFYYERDDCPEDSCDYYRAWSVKMRLVEGFVLRLEIGDTGLVMDVYVDRRSFDAARVGEMYFGRGATTPQVEEEVLGERTHGSPHHV